MELQVNGDRRSVGVPSHYTLLETIRYGLGMTGSKQGCDKGDCGACTVLMGGRSIKSCTYLAVSADSKEIVTIEGLSRNGELHPIQEAFWENHGLQCGYCTPGMILSAAHLLAKNPNPTDAQIRIGIAGNVCRCTGYQNIVNSIQKAAETQ